jgi:hypothetical protein
MANRGSFLVSGPQGWWILILSPAPQTFMRAIGKLGELVWVQWDELRHAAAVIGAVFLLCVRPRHWAPKVRNLFARQVLAVHLVLEIEAELLLDEEADLEHRERVEAQVGERRVGEQRLAVRPHAAFDQHGQSLLEIGRRRAQCPGFAAS